MPVVDSSSALFDKENISPDLFSMPTSKPTAPKMSPSTKKPQASRGVNSNGKRSLMEAAPIKDSRSNKRSKTTHNEEPVEIPAWDAFPPIIDDGQKPGHSYAQLIGMAILRSPNRRLTLAQIYKWISDTFSFYRAHDAGWQNSIRHNLSLNKAFAKMERSKDDPGKGSYWFIIPGMESQFLKDRPVRKTSSASEHTPIMPSRSESFQQPAKSSCAPDSQSRSTAQRKKQSKPEPTELSLPPLPVSQGLLAPAADVLSDATIPISDIPGNDENVEGIHNITEFDSFLYSSVPPLLNSASPFLGQFNMTNHTPSSQVIGSSVSQSHRSSISVHDSGFVSSVDSSMVRPHVKPQLSELERPRHMRGCAEEEIARIRAPSLENSAKNRAVAGHVTASSSPQRPSSMQMAPPLPLTPISKFRTSMTVPASASPSTSLRIHRDTVQSMLQSPMSKFPGMFNETTTWGAYNVEEQALVNDPVTNPANLDLLFSFSNEEMLGLSALPSESISPPKRPAKRGKSDRSQAFLGEELKIWEDEPASVETTKNSYDIKPVPTGDLMGRSAKRDMSSVTHGTSSGKVQDVNIASNALMNATAPVIQPAVNIQAPELSWQALDYSQEYNAGPYTNSFGLDMLQGFHKLGSSEGQYALENKENGNVKHARFFPAY
ncbi:hypothetical protein TD95_001858 [Thielaviopsis punctulata]|uniref:Fork-head domain-containing protein n=1 Tax=Thielaviopsis punctulata TaxID=72032 RepID=A0A0F4ZCL5_9PEZI|nr:hypothetical protein TD95_001858 [Thielaviopsis punctulata]